MNEAHIRVLDLSSVHLMAKNQNGFFGPKKLPFAFFLCNTAILEVTSKLLGPQKLCFALKTATPIFKDFHNYAFRYIVKCHYNVKLHNFTNY